MQQNKIKSRKLNSWIGKDLETDNVVLKIIPNILIILRSILTSLWKIILSIYI